MSRYAKLSLTELEADREALEAAIEANGGKTGPQWLPIESAPRDGTEVLLWTDTRKMFDQAWLELCGLEHFAKAQVGFWEDAVNAPLRTEAAGWRTHSVGEPTHWMPLPPPPSALVGMVEGR